MWSIKAFCNNSASSILLTIILDKRKHIVFAQENYNDKSIQKSLKAKSGPLI